MAIGLSDLLLVPVPPRAVDVWALGNLARLIDEARAAREADGHPPLRVLGLLNMADPGSTPDNQDTIATLADYPQLPWSTHRSAGARRWPTPRPMGWPSAR